jgi:hypothetical protein
MRIAGSHQILSESQRLDRFPPEPCTVKQHAALRSAIRSTPPVRQLYKPAATRSGVWHAMVERLDEPGEFVGMLPVVVVEPGDNRTM